MGVTVFRVNPGWMEFLAEAESTGTLVEMGFPEHLVLMERLAKTARMVKKVVVSLAVFLLLPANSNRLKLLIPTKMFVKFLLAFIMKLYMCIVQWYGRCGTRLLRKNLTGKYVYYTFVKIMHSVI